MQLEHFVVKQQKKLRCGYTTGSCAALATQAATRMLLGGRTVHSASLLTPKGIALCVPVTNICRTPNQVRCAVQKDSGDDPDITNGVLIYAAVSKISSGIMIEGGQGVGRVTQKGLEQPVGQAAINRVPRQMIQTQVQNACREFGYTGGILVVISAPQGEELAKKTFNPRLGITGGISILGTSGIVEPMSEEALCESISLEIGMAAQGGNKKLVLTPGNYGEAFLQAFAPLQGIPAVKCSNFVGHALDSALLNGFEQVFLVGHVGKFAKLACGVMNTHSSVADARAEVFAAHAALAGATKDVVRLLMHAPTTDAMLQILQQFGLAAPVLQSILQKIDEHVARRVHALVQAGTILFNNPQGLLGVSPQAEQMLRNIKENS